MSVLVSCLSPVEPGWKWPQESTRRPSRCPDLPSLVSGAPVSSWWPQWLLSLTAVRPPTHSAREGVRNCFLVSLKPECLAHGQGAGS